MVSQHLVLRLRPNTRLARLHQISLQVMTAGQFHVVEIHIHISKEILQEGGEGGHVSDM
jgi:hypothetical protein